MDADQRQRLHDETHNDQDARDTYPPLQTFTDSVLFGFSQDFISLRLATSRTLL